MGMVDRLRMASLFPSAGNHPFGPPDTSDDGYGLFRALEGATLPLIQQENNRERMHESNMQTQEIQQQNRLAQIGQAVKSQQPPMNTVLGNQGITAYQNAQLGMDREELGLKREALHQKEGAQERTADIAASRAQTYASMHDMSDSEKLDVVNRARRGDIEARGMIQQALQDTRGKQMLEQIGVRGDIQKELADTRGEQNLAGIAARVAGNKEVQSMKLGADEKPMLPTQERVDIGNRAREIVNTRPDLASFITMDNSGNPVVSPNATPEIQSIIQSMLYPGKDVQLKPEGKVFDNAKPVKKVEAAKPSKYKVSIK